VSLKNESDSGLNEKIRVKHRFPFHSVPNLLENIVNIVEIARMKRAVKFKIVKHEGERANEGIRQT
jgi:hypothetical protein